METPEEPGTDVAGASGGANSSAGSSPRGLPPEAEIHDVSSGSDDRYLVVPSRRAEEEEDSDDEDALLVRHESRSKANHDRHARAQEEAEASAKAGQAGSAEA